MEIRELSPEELDYVSAVCLDPSIPPKWREAMKPHTNVRTEWLKSMMGIGLQVSVALDKPREVISSLCSKNAKFREMITGATFRKA